MGLELVIVTEPVSYLFCLTPAILAFPEHVLSQPSFNHPGGETPRVLTLVEQTRSIAAKYGHPGRQILWILAFLPGLVELVQNRLCGRRARSLWGLNDELRINRPQLRMLSHNDFVRCERNHGGRGHCGERHEHTDVSEPLPQVFHYGFRCLGRAPRAVEDQIQFGFIDVRKHLHEPLDVGQGDLESIRRRGRIAQPGTGVQYHCPAGVLVNELEIAATHAVAVWPDSVR